MHRHGRRDAKQKRLTVRRNNRSNNHCVPAVMSMLSGWHVDECVYRIHKFRTAIGQKKTPVRAVWFHEVNSVFHLARLGLYLHDIKKGWGAAKPFIKQARKFTKTEIYALTIWNKKRDKNWSHAVLVYGGKLYDNVHPNGVKFKNLGTYYKESLLWSKYRILKDTP